MHARARSLCPPTIESIEYRSESSSPLPGYADSDRIFGVPARAYKLRARSQVPVERAVCATFAEPTRPSVVSVFQASEAPTRGTCVNGFLRNDSAIRPGAQTPLGLRHCQPIPARRASSRLPGTPVITANWLGGQSGGPAQVRDPRQHPAPSEQPLAVPPPSARIPTSGLTIPCILRIRSLHPNVDARCSLRCSRLKEALSRKDPEGLAERPLHPGPCGPAAGRST